MTAGKKRHDREPQGEPPTAAPAAKEAASGEIGPVAGIDSPGADSPAVEIPIEDSIDLHAFRPSEIPEVVRTYLEEAAARGLAEVRIIHGRGIGFQRDRVRAVLAAHPLVVRFADAPPERGHWGATLVILRTTYPETT